MTQNQASKLRENRAGVGFNLAFTVMARIKKYQK